jgi:beta-hydroxyacyl-ACP dehydratase FabZ
MLTRQDIRRLLPYRYPFLLVDEVLDCELGVRLVARKLVSFDEPYFAGTGTDLPEMPGMLVIEALAQAGGLLLLAALDDPTGQVVYFASLDAVRWHAPVRPGDDLRLHVTVLKSRGALRKVHGEARVDGAASGDVAVTADIPLAALLVAAGVAVIDPRGEEYTTESVGERLSVPNFMDGLRSAGVETGGHGAYGPREKQAFANALDRVLTRAPHVTAPPVTRDATGAPPYRPRSRHRSRAAT